MHKSQLQVASCKLQKKDQTKRSYNLKPVTCNSQSGNAFIFILLGVALFGALGFAVARGFQSDTTSNLSKREADLAASEILAYAQKVERAVNRMRRRGCGENMISYENEFYPTNTANPRAPDDKSCHLFEPEGGNMKYLDIPEEWLTTKIETAQAGTSQYRGHFAFVGSAKVSGVGQEDKADVMIVIPWLSDTLCEELAERGGSNFRVGGTWFQHHLGPYQIREPPQHIDTESPAIACQEYGGGWTELNGVNTFHAVIIAR